MKPQLFVGSSTESLNIAHVIQEELEHDADVTVWNQGIFELTNYTLDSLQDCIEETDYGLFVFTPDDISIIREKENKVVRDNVIFELGLFIGRIGKERTFILIPSGHENFHFPSDLLGITPATYNSQRPDGNLRAAVGPACSKIRKAMSRFGSRIHEKTEVIPKNFLDAIEFAAKTHPEDHIRIACARAVWSYRPVRAIPILEDARNDMSEEVRNHANDLLLKYPSKVV